MFEIKLFYPGPGDQITRSPALHACIQRGGWA